MAHRIALATLLALVLGGASPAFALTRLASFEWEPATGPVAGYAVYASAGGDAEEFIEWVAEPGTVLAVESSTFVTVRVAAYDATGALGPLSEPSSAVRLCPGDFDADETIGLSDWADTRSCFGQVATGLCAGADLDLDGVVGILDVQSVDLGADACALASAQPTCPGDFDGDGGIGLDDWTAARSCLGQPAQGACAAGDFDGDGIVSFFEVNYVAQAVGSDACTL